MLLMVVYCHDLESCEAPQFSGAAPARHEWLLNLLEPCTRELKVLTRQTGDCTILRSPEEEKVSCLIARK